MAQRPQVKLDRLGSRATIRCGSSALSLPSLLCGWPRPRGCVCMSVSEGDDGRRRERSGAQTWYSGIFVPPAPANAGSPGCLCRTDTGSCHDATAPFSAEAKACLGTAITYWEHQE